MKHPSNDFSSLAQVMKSRGTGAKTVKTAGPGIYISWKDSLKALNAAESAFLHDPSPANSLALQHASNIYHSTRKHPKNSSLNPQNTPLQKKTPLKPQ